MVREVEKIENVKEKQKLLFMVVICTWKDALFS